ncbi:hypothetical protein WME91_37065 [Sorangium sp. So ce269]
MHSSKRGASAEQARHAELGLHEVVTLGRAGTERILRDQEMIGRKRREYSDAGGDYNDCQRFDEVLYKICGLFKA